MEALAETSGLFVLGNPTLQLFSRITNNQR